MKNMSPTLLPAISVALNIVHYFNDFHLELASVTSCNISYLPVKVRSKLVQAF